MSDKIYDLLSSIYKGMLTEDNNIDELKKETRDRIIEFNIPIYMKIIYRIQRYFPFPEYSIALLIGLSLYLIGIPFSLLTNLDLSVYTKCWLSFNASGMITGAFLLMPYIYHKSIDYLDDFLYMCNKNEQVSIIEKYYELMFNAKKQTIFGIGVSLFFLFNIGFAGLPFTFSQNLWFFLGAGAALFFISQGIYFMLILFLFIYIFSNTPYGYKLNFINPSKSIGVMELANLSSRWAFCVFCEAVLVLIGMVIGPWSNEYFRNYIMTFWSIVIIFLIIISFVYPQICIEKIIVNYKRFFRRETMDFMIDHVNKFRNNDKDIPLHLKEEFSSFEELNNIYLSITNSSNYAIDLSILSRFISSLILPSLILVFREGDTFLSFLNYLKSLVI